jgi:hypothetical protein
MNLPLGSPGRSQWQKKTPTKVKGKVRACQLVKEK